MELIVIRPKQEGEERLEAVLAVALAGIRVLQVIQTQIC